MMRLAWLLVLVFATIGCGNDGPVRGDDFGNILNSPEGLVLVVEEHPTGWRRPDCFSCHPARNMHTINRTGLEDLDLAEIRAIVRNQGEASCAQCHGDNGVGE